MRYIRTFLIGFFFLFVLISLIKNIIDFQEKKTFYQGFQNEYETEKKRNITLKTQILKESDRNELEKTIRNKLNLLRPDETAIILPQPTPTPVIITPTTAPNWYQWKEVFF